MRGLYIQLSASEKNHFLCCEPNGYDTLKTSSLGDSWKNLSLPTGDIMSAVCPSVCLPTIGMYTK
jgi:hypothetical protein